MAILLSNKVDFRAKKISVNRQGHYISILESIHQEDVSILTVSTSNNQSSKIREAKADRIEKKNRQIHNYTDFNSPSQQLMEEVDRK